MDHAVIFLWVLLSITAYVSTTTTTTEQTIPSLTESYGCGETFTEPSASFTGPYYYGNRNIVQCLWTIQSNEYLPIKLTIDYLTLDCAHEYINIYDGEVDRSELLGRICSGSSWTFISYSGTMKVLLHRDSSKASQGFFAYYDIGELETTPYPQPTEGTEVFSTQEATEVFSTQELETTTQPQTTDVLGSMPSAESTAASAPSTENIPCGGILSDSSGYIYTPYYPGSGMLQECIWEIHAASHDIVALQFYFVDNNINCYSDYITIYNGNVGSSKELGRICSYTSRVFRSTSNIMTVTLHRHSYNSGPTFTAHYYTAPTDVTPSMPPAESTALPIPTTGESLWCGGNLSNPYGNIDSPYYPGNNISIKCTWEIQAAHYNHIVLYFNYVKILNCITDYIVIYDGGLDSRQLGRICSSTYRSYVSTSNTMTLVLYRQSDQWGEAFSAYYYTNTPATAPGSESPSDLITNGEPEGTHEATTVGAEYTTHPSIANQCGGNLSFPYGSISGPYYPGNNVSMQCVWEIEVSSFERIVLRFSYISLDCNEEFVDILDGSPSSSELLGRTCSNTYLNYSYISTSNKMTVLLYRDSNDPGNGFYANYYSIPQETTPTAPPSSETTSEIPLNSSSVPSRALSCSGEYMRARISRAYLRLIGYDAWEVYLNSSDPVCMPQITQSYVIFNIPFSGCGTVRQEKNNDSIIYSNIIVTSASGYIITRKSNFQFHIMCEMNKNTVVETMFVARNSVDITERQRGNYNVTISFFESSSFYYEVYRSPYYVSLNQDLYLQATLHSSDQNLVLFLDTCKASPNADDFTTLTYDLIRSGCTRDSTYRNLYSPSSNAVRFKFNSFKFLNQHNAVYLQCKLIVCEEYDYSSRCYQGCLTRKKREAGEPQEKVEVVLGPFQLQKEANENRKQELVKSVSPEKNDALSPLTVSTVLLAAMVFVLSGFLLSSKLRRKDYHQIY